MNFSGWLFLLFLLCIGGSGALVAYGQPLGKRVCRLALIIPAFFGAVLLLRAGCLDGIGNAIVDKLAESAGAKEYLGGSEAMRTLTAGLINYTLRVLLFTAIFWIFYGVLILILALVLKYTKLKETAFFANVERKGVKIASGAIGGVLVLSLFLLSLTPITVLAVSLSPAISEATAEENKNTYCGELATEIGKSMGLFAQKSLTTRTLTVTGTLPLAKLTGTLLGKTEMRDNRSDAVECNIYKLLTEVSVDGIRAVNVYEASLSTGSTLGQFSPGAEILKSLSGCEPLLAVMCDLAENSAGVGDDSLPQKPVAEVLSDYAGKGGRARLGADITTLADVLDVFLTDNGTKKYDTETLPTLIMQYYEDEAHAQTLSAGLRALTVFEKAVSCFSDYGVQALCEALHIDYDEEALYRAFLSDLTERLNDREQGNFDEAFLGEFIGFLIEEGQTVEEYRKAHYREEENKEDDGYINHLRYLNSAAALADLLADYGLTDAAYQPGLTVNGTVYLYRAETDRWEPLPGKETDCNAVILCLLLFAAGYRNSEQGLSEETVKNYLEQTLAGEVAALTATTGGAYRQYSADLAATLADKDRLAGNRVLGKTIKAAVQPMDPTRQEADAKALAGAVSVACEMFALLKTDSGTVSETYLLNNFSKVGRAMDALQGFSATEKVPSLMLRAICQQEEYKKYIDQKSISAVTGNIESGKSTYTEFLTSVQSLYRIANEII